MNLRSRILALSEKLAPTFVEIRRHLHRNPELAFQEYETTRYLRSWLEKADLTIRSGFAETGVVGYCGESSLDPWWHSVATSMPYR